MTMRITITNDDPIRIARVSVLDRSTSAGVPTCHEAEVHTVEPGKSCAVYIHSSRYITVEEEPAKVG